MAVYSVGGEWQTGGRELIPVPDSEVYFPAFFGVLQQTEGTILDFVYDPRAEQLQRAAAQVEQAVTDIFAKESLESLAEMLEWIANDEEPDLEVPIGYAAGQDLPLRSHEAFLLPRTGSPLKVIYHEAGAESSAAFSMRTHDGPMVTWLNGASEAGHFYFSENTGTVPRDFSAALQIANVLPGSAIISQADYEWAAISRIPLQRQAGSVPGAVRLGSITLRKLT